MSELYNPVWDDAGKLREGCTIGEACQYLITSGVSPSVNIIINGTFYTLDAASHDTDLCAKAIKTLSPGYYGTHGFTV